MCVYVYEDVLKPSPHANKTDIASFIIKLLRFFFNWTWTVNDKKPNNNNKPVTIKKLFNEIKTQINTNKNL